MQIRHDPNAPKPSKRKFSEISGHHSVIDREKIKRENHERLLAKVAEGVQKLHDAVSHERTRRKVQKLLSEEN